MSSNDELACVYAALVLLDDDVAITVTFIVKSIYYPTGPLTRYHRHVNTLFSGISISLSFQPLSRPSHSSADLITIIVVLPQRLISNLFT